MQHHYPGGHVGNKSHKPPKKKKHVKNRKGGQAAVRNGRMKNRMNTTAGGVCQKCGHPARDGKLCDFHRHLLNSIRNGFR